MPVLESVVALKAVVGIAGVASALFVNRDSAGNFKFDEIPKAIFGEAIGGIYADFFKEGIGSGYASLKAKYEQVSLDKDTLNHDLQKAARKAQLIATFFAAQYCLEQVRAENNSAETFAGKTLERAKNLVVTDSREAYLKEVINYLNDEIKNVDKAVFSGTLSFDEFVSVFDVYRQVIESGSQASVSESLKEDIIRELEILSTFPNYKFDRDAFSLLAATIQTGWEELPPERVLSEHFVTLDISSLERAPSGKNYDWFYLVCSIFNEEYKNNPRVAADAQKQLLLKIFGALETFGTLTSDISTLTAKISDFAEELKQIREGIGRLEEGQTEIKDGVTEVNKRTARIEERLNTIAPEKSDSQNLVGLPSLRDKVYGREEELGLLNDFLERGKQFGIIIAPTCFGKTYLIKKFLQTIVEVGGVKSEYRRFVKKVIYLDCRENQTMTRILQSFANLLGKELKYQQSELLSDLFTEIQKEKILLIFDNFESWIDENGRYSVGQTSDRATKDESVETFLNALFNSQHRIRVIFVSQKIPNSERDFVLQVEQLKRVSDELEKGLKPEAALELTRKEGANVGLDKVSDEALERFFQKVYYIPQAIQSMIGYLETVGESFAKFEREFWEDFDREESDEQNIEKRLSAKMRPTKALIKRQILAQNETTKFLLSVLAFFSTSVPKEVLGLSLSVTGKIESAVESSRAIKTLVDNRLVKFEADLVKEQDAKTGSEEEIIYFMLHPYLRDVIQEYLPKFETENQKILGPFAEALLLKGDESEKQTYYRRAIGFYESVEKIIEHLVFRLKHKELQEILAVTYMCKGIVLANFGKLDEAKDEFEKSIKIREQLVLRENKLELRNDLAMTYTNKGVTLNQLQRSDESINEVEKAIKIYEQLILKENKSESKFNLASSYILKGVAFDTLERWEDGINEFEKAIEILEHLVLQESNLKLQLELAGAYANKGIALQNLLRLHESIDEFEKAIEILEPLILKENKLDRRKDLASAYMNKGNTLSVLDRSEEAINEFEKSIKILEHLVLQEGRLELRNILAMAYVNKGITVTYLQRWDEAIQEYDNAINLWIAENAFHNLPNLMKGVRFKNISLIQIKDWQKTARNALFALGFAEILGHPSHSEQLKQLAGQEIGDILFQIKELTDKEKKEVYQYAGKQGEYLRELVEQI